MKNIFLTITICIVYQWNSMSAQIEQPIPKDNDCNVAIKDGEDYIAINLQPTDVAKDTRMHTLPCDIISQIQSKRNSSDTIYWYPHPYILIKIFPSKKYRDDVSPLKTQ